MLGFKVISSSVFIDIHKTLLILVYLLMSWRLSKKKKITIAKGYMLKKKLLYKSNIFSQKLNTEMEVQFSNTYYILYIYNYILYIYNYILYICVII